jgi:hypothetical protein
MFLVRAGDGKGRHGLLFYARHLTDVNDSWEIDNSTTVGDAHAARCTARQCAIPVT